MGKEEDVIKALHVVSHPIRFRLLEKIGEKRKAHINALAQALGEERRLVSYHLLTLEEFGVVASRYVISEEQKSRGKALREYWLTEAGLAAYDAIKQAVSSVESR